MKLPMIPLLSTAPIPRVIHQIWVGSQPPPWVRDMWDRWDLFVVENPDWKVKRWLDADVEDSPALSSTARVARGHRLSFRGQADLLRVQILAMYGGLYFDSDTIPLRTLDPWAGNRSAWVGSGPRTVGRSMLANASFGMPRGHRFLSEVWSEAQTALNRGLTNDHHVAGPMVFRRVSERVPVEIHYTFENEDPPDLVALAKKRQPLDLDDMRRRWPDCPVFHLLINYGNWKGRTAND